MSSGFGGGGWGLGTPVVSYALRLGVLVLSTVPQSMMEIEVDFGSVFEETKETDL